MTKEEAIKTLKKNYCSMCAYGSCDMDNCDISYCDNREAIEVLSAVPEREKGEFDGMTNGEVLKSIFPTAELILGNSEHIPDVICVKEEWWNASYKAKSEEK